jgi:hypothetical protein
MAVFIKKNAWVRQPSGIGRYKINETNYLTNRILNWQSGDYLGNWLTPNLSAVRPPPFIQTNAGLAIQLGTTSDGYRTEFSRVIPANIMTALFVVKAAPPGAALRLGGIYATSGLQFFEIQSTAANTWAVNVIDFAVGFSSVVVNSNVSISNDWQTIAAVQRSATSRAIWVGGQQRATNSTSVNFTLPSYGFFGDTTLSASVLLSVFWYRALSDQELRAVSQNPWQLFRPQQQVFYSLPSGGAQTLTPDRYDNTNTFYAPIVTSAYQLVAGRYDNQNTFYSPTVTTTYALTPARYDNSNTFYSPTVITNAVTLLPARYDNVSTFYTPTVTTGAVTLLPGRYDNASTFYSPTVTSGAFILLPDRYDNAQTFYSPTVTAGTVTLTPARYDNAQTFYTPTVSLASQVLRPDRFDNVNTFYSPSLAVVTLYKFKYWDGSAWQILKKNPLF